MTFWIAIHAGLLWVGFIAFTLAFVGATLYFYAESILKNRNFGGMSRYLPPLESIDRMTKWTVVIGFIFLTLGILIGGNLIQIFGLAMAHPDVKLILTLITWGLFAAYLLLRWLLHWQGKQTNYVIVVGFALVLLTYVGASLR